METSNSNVSWRPASLHHRNNALILDLRPTFPPCVITYSYTAPLAAPSPPILTWKHVSCKLELRNSGMGRKNCHNCQYDQKYRTGASAECNGDLDCTGSHMWARGILKQQLLNEVVTPNPQPCTQAGHVSRSKLGAKGGVTGPNLHNRGAACFAGARSTVMVPMP